ncbi:MAG: ribonuclease HII [Spirochaetaceae bacterium]|jgi:ribonuclease HII|nr:ribonuclease HII [Spirochaetaceae bacterium]
MICGIDEAGRGPLAGPVCAAAVILPENFPRNILGDSKKLSPRRREEAMTIIYRGAFAWGIGWASAFEIDRINILKASLLAMKRAFEELAAASGTVLAALPPGLSAIVDGLYVPDIPLPCRALVKADAQVPEVMAASILAKTARDRMMERYSWIYPDYGYDRHKGYPTQEHLKRIALHGPSPIQRRSFRVKPVQLPLFNHPPRDGGPQAGGS